MTNLACTTRKGRKTMKKCNHDCFNCVFDDCVCDTVTKDEKFMQDYRDKCATVTGYIPKGHSSKKGNKGRKGGRYDSSILAIGRRQNGSK